MLTCRRVTELLSEAQEHPLSLRDRAALRMHTMLCDGCRNFGRQMDVLRKLSRSYAPSADANPKDESPSK